MTDRPYRGRVQQAVLFMHGDVITCQSPQALLKVVICFPWTLYRKQQGCKPLMPGLTPGDLDKVIPAHEPRFISDKQITSGFAGSTFAIDGVQNKIYPAWKGYAQEANAASQDATKLVTGSKEFNDYLEKYKDLPEAGEYKIDLAAYQQVSEPFAARLSCRCSVLFIERPQVCRWWIYFRLLPPAWIALLPYAVQVCASTSAKVLQNTAQFQQYQQLGLQVAASKANTEDIQGMLAGLHPNPAAVEFANYISGSYVLAQQSVLQSIYQINQVSGKDWHCANRLSLRVALIW